MLSDWQSPVHRINDKLNGLFLCKAKNLDKYRKIQENLMTNKLFSVIVTIV
ncbi:hypothetical protein OBV_20320 [Oscillibacter valericigenes Sjm18-20]|nr:hypothetical protein OBV_20320 [Oscillibacter valericigenes Sjm18-20]